MKKPRAHALPHCAAIDQLAPGVAWNPYNLFEGWSVRHAITSAKKLRPGAKLVWLILADEVYASGYDRKTQTSLAWLAGLSVDQLQRHLKRLVKAKLVHVEYSLGAQNFHWLLYSDLFANCSPLPPRNNAVAPPAEVRQGVPQKRGTQRNYQRNFQRSNGVDVNKATSYRGSPDANGRKHGEDEDAENTDAQAPITNRALTLAVKPEASAFWYGLSAHAKRNRQAQAASEREQIDHYSQYLKHPDPKIAHQARHEVNRHMAALSQLGFYLKPATDRS